MLNQMRRERIQKKKRILLNSVLFFYLNCVVYSWLEYVILQGENQNLDIQDLTL